MTDSDNRAYATHESASMLLPWYINGSLDDEQRQMVDSHLAVCVTCRSELKTQRHVAEVVRSQNAASVGANIGFAQICQRIQPARRTLYSRVCGWALGRLPAPSWAWASAIAVAASVFVALPLLDKPVDRVSIPETFRTLSADNGHLDFRENSLRVVFAEGLEDEIRQDILRMVNPVAVTEPTSRGVLTVQVADGELASALALLRDRKEVRLAEPVFSGAEIAGGD